MHFPPECGSDAPGQTSDASGQTRGWSGYVILPFGVSKEDQLQTQGIAPNLIQSRCIICLEDESATHGFVCNGHKHYLYCSSCTTHSSITTKCAICRKTHSSGPQAL